MRPREWIPASQARRDTYGNENRQRWRVQARSKATGRRVWRGWFDDRNDADAFLFALYTGAIYHEPSIWRLPTPHWHPDLSEDVTYQFVTVSFVTTTGSSTFLKPADWNNAANQIETVGGGGGGFTPSAHGGGGGGGGAYNTVSNITLTTDATVQVSIRVSASTVGGDTWFNGSTLALSSCGSKGGGAGLVSSNSAGGVGTSGVGTGTNGGASGSCTTGVGAGGGGGAGGPHGVGGAGGANGGSANFGCGGGGNGGGTAGANGTTGTGGNNYLGAGGAAHDTTSTNGGGGGGNGSAGAGAGAGSTGPDWSSRGTGGGGGGGGNGTSKAGGAGGNYGGGGGGGGFSVSGGTGGQGGQGLIVITYTPLVIANTVDFDEWPHQLRSTRMVGYDARYAAGWAAAFGETLH